MRIFISGGCKNGKSMHAQRIAKKMRRDGAPLYYLATMAAKDDEDHERISRHRKDREGWGFKTVEIPDNIINVLEICDPAGSFLLDSVTALLENEMFGDNLVRDAYKKVSHELTSLLKNIGDIVIVSDYIYSDAFIYDELVEQYRRGLAHIDRELAAACDIVLDVCCGHPIAYKGGEFWRDFNAD